MIDGILDQVYFRVNLMTFSPTCGYAIDAWVYNWQDYI